MSTGATSPQPEKPEPSVDTTNPASQAATTTVFKPERTHVLAGIMMAAISVFIIGWAPQYLWWILLLPALFIYWALRAQTTVSEDGIAIRYAFRKGVSLDWEEIQGVGFKGATTLLRDTSGNEHPMPAITFNSIPELSRASRGRIPDALTSGLAAQDGKVAVINQDGRQVLVSKEEYEARQARAASDDVNGND